MTTIELYSGNVFDFARPAHNIVTIEDIAHGLAGERRYANQLDLRNADGTRAIYSVAEHSLHVLRLVQQRWRELTWMHAGHHQRQGIDFAKWRGQPLTRNDERWAHGHDSPEAIVRDIPGPAKDFIPGYRDMEAQVMESCRAALGIVGSEPPIVKLADTLVGRAERYFFRGDEPPPVWVLDVVRPLCWPEDVAEARFLQAHRELH